MWVPTRPFGRRFGDARFGAGAPINSVEICYFFFIRLKNMKKGTKNLKNLVLLITAHHRLNPNGGRGVRNSQRDEAAESAKFSSPRHNRMFYSESKPL
jgi:hypothetical protein